MSSKYMGSLLNKRTRHRVAVHDRGYRRGYRLDRWKPESTAAPTDKRDPISERAGDAQYYAWPADTSRSDSDSDSLPRHDTP
jgi:hypothetical protein